MITRCICSLYIMNTLHVNYILYIYIQIYMFLAASMTSDGGRMRNYMLYVIEIRTELQV